MKDENCLHFRLPARLINSTTHELGYPDLARNPVALGNFIFSSKSAAQKAIREMMARNKDDVPLTGADLLLAEAVLATHPQVDYKRRHGCKGIVIVKAKGYSTRCLAIVTEDDGKEEFSFTVAIGISPCTPVLGAAARNAVADSTRAFKAGIFANDEVRCAVNGTVLLWEDAHVDHAPPWTFDRIVQEFQKEFGEVALKHEGNQDLFQTEADALRFREYHDARADLRVIHRRVNLSTLRIKDRQT